MSPGAPELAESVVVHARHICEQQDHLSRVLQHLSIPTEELTDSYSRQGSQTFDFDAILKAFLYREIRGFSDSELSTRLEQRRASVGKWFGFERAPTQQTLSNSWRNRLDAETRRFVKAAATGIAREAIEHDVIHEELVAVEPAREETDEDGEPSSEYKKEQTQKVVELTRKYAHEFFDTDRASNTQYSDEQVFDMHARLAANKASAHEEGQYGSLVDAPETCHGTTFLRALKQLNSGVENDQSGQARIHEFSPCTGCADTERTEMRSVERIREAILEPFNQATDHILRSISDHDIFEDREVTVAIDITHEQFFASPWEDKSAGVAKDEYPPMVSGYQKDGTTKRGYKYATITLVGEMTPIILGIEPVKEDSAWEDEDSPSYSKATLVERLLDRAQEHVDIDRVLFDRGFDSHDVYAAVDDQDMTYLAPRPKYQADLDAIEQVQQAEDADAAVQHDVELAVDGDVHHEVEYLYVPSSRDDQEGQYAVFVTNEDRVEPAEIQHVTAKYRRRWEIENQYKLIKKFLPQTSSTDYRIRLSNFMVACLLHNLWRLTDYLLKFRLDRGIRDDPELTMGVFARVVGEFARRYG